MSRNCIVIVLSVSILLIIFYVIPLINPKYCIVDTTNSTNLNTTKTYFDTISPIFTFIFSSLAILLGFYYYKNKNDIEENRNKKQRHVNFANEILSNIKESSEYAYKIIHASINSQQELDLCRSKLLQNEDYLETLLDCAIEVYKWDSLEYKEIMRHRSFISKNSLIAYATFDKIVNDAALRLKTAEQYKVLLNNSKYSCFLKIEKIFSS